MFGIVNPNKLCETKTQHVMDGKVLQGERRVTDVLSAEMEDNSRMLMQKKDDASTGFDSLTLRLETVFEGSSSNHLRS